MIRGAQARMQMQNAQNVQNRRVRAVARARQAGGALGPADDSMETDADVVHVAAAFFSSWNLPKGERARAYPKGDLAE
jgi:hypothetical protein